MTGPQPFPNLGPRNTHGAEQMWAEANAYLDGIIKLLKEKEPAIYRIAQNSDASVLYDWLKAFVQGTENQPGPLGEAAHGTTMLMCCAAITRLVRSERAEADDVLAQLEKELGNHDDH